MTAGPNVVATRLSAAALQAALLLLLTKAAGTPHIWPATAPAVFVPLLVVSLLVPPLVMFGAGWQRRIPLVAWTLLATLITAGLGLHEATRGPAFDHWSTALRPPFAFWLAVGAALFVAHVLVTDSVAEGRLMPSYRRHFDTAWKLALQTILAAAFVGVFWGILELGAGLFQLVDIAAFTRLLRHDWFYVPATTLAAALAIQATDVQPALIRGTRSLVLTLFSWLLPLLSAILGAFLVSLPFLSLQALWNTHFATTLLLTAAATLTFLVNCCYQDGSAAPTVRMKRIAASLGAIELLPVVGLACWALALRVAQHGWTEERVEAAALVAIAACYALGYATATLRSHAWMSLVEVTNLIAAWLVLAAVLLLFSPLADPSRLMVASQLARLRSGATSPDHFDLRALRFDGARWGAAALAKLARQHDPISAAIASRAKFAMALQSRDAADAPRPDQVIGAIEVLPLGRMLPAELFAQDSPQRWFLQSCFNQRSTTRCVARYMALHPGDAESLALAGAYGGFVFQHDAGRGWHEVATLAGAYQCLRSPDHLAPDRFATQPHPFPDIVIGGQAFTVVPLPPPCRPAVGVFEAR